MKISLRRFDPQAMVPRDGRIIMVIGRRGSGKSTLIEDLMFKLHTRYDYGVGMSPTRTSIEMMEQHFPNAMIFDEGFSMDQFQKMMALSSLLAKRHKLKNGLLTMDDCNADKQAFRSKIMRDAFMNGRHYGVNIIWAMHYVMDILPDLRSQVDFVFVLKDSIRKNKERLYNNFFGMFDKYEDFAKVMDQCTENRECLVLDNTSPTPDPAKCLYWYKANPKMPPFRIGKPIFYSLTEYYKNRTPPPDDLLKVTIRPGQPNDHGKVASIYNASNPRVEMVEKIEASRNQHQHQHQQEQEQEQDQEQREEDNNNQLFMQYHQQQQQRQFTEF